MTVRRAEFWRPRLARELLQAPSDDSTRVLYGQRLIDRLLLKALVLLLLVWAVVAGRIDGALAVVLPLIPVPFLVRALRLRVVLSNRGIAVANFLSTWAVPWSDLDGAVIDQRDAVCLELADGTVLRASMHQGGTSGFGYPQRRLRREMCSEIADFALRHGVIVEDRSDDF